MRGPGPRRLMARRRSWLWATGTVPSAETRLSLSPIHRQNRSRIWDRLALRTMVRNQGRISAVSPRNLGIARSALRQESWTAS